MHERARSEIRPQLLPSRRVEITVPLETLPQHPVSAEKKFWRCVQSSRCSRGGGGTLVGTDIFQNVLRTDFVTLTGLAPGQRFTINEVFTFSQVRCCIPGLPQGDVGAAILTMPSDPVAVPGRVVGAALPGLMFGALVFSAGGDGAETPLATSRARRTPALTLQTSPLSHRRSPSRPSR
jgi:hypothetical protein